MRTSTIKNREKLWASLVWLALWELGARYLKNPILLPRPGEVFLSLVSLLGQFYFWTSCLNSIFKIGLGFFLGIILGLGLALLAYRLRILEVFIEPAMSIVKSVPVASIVVILLIWFTSLELPVLIVVLMVTPNIYYTSLEGLATVDQDLLDMSRVFGVNRWKIFKYIYFEKLKKVLMPSIVVSSGLAWKSGVSAEVLGLVKNSIGENIYYSKLYLDTRELFAWTFVIVLISRAFSLTFEHLLRRTED